MLIDPRDERYFVACRLEFECTNNIAEYEALIQGLKKAIDLGAKALVVLGDSEIIIIDRYATLYTTLLVI